MPVGIRFYLTALTVLFASGNVAGSKDIDTNEQHCKFDGLIKIGSTILAPNSPVLPKNIGTRKLVLRTGENQFASGVVSIKIEYELSKGQSPVVLVSRETYRAPCPAENVDNGSYSPEKVESSKYHLYHKFGPKTDLSDSDLRTKIDNFHVQRRFAQSLFFSRCLKSNSLDSYHLWLFEKNPAQAEFFQRVRKFRHSNEGYRNKFPQKRDIGRAVINIPYRKEKGKAGCIKAKIPNEIPLKKIVSISYADPDSFHKIPGGLRKRNIRWE